MNPSPMRSESSPTFPGDWRRCAVLTLFIKIAKRILQEMDNVLFIVAGSDKHWYGNDLNHIQSKTFLEHVIRREQPDLSHFLFPGMLPSASAELFSLSDLHIYLTVPFVLSVSAQRHVLRLYHSRL